MSGPKRALAWTRVVFLLSILAISSNADAQEDPYIAHAAKQLAHVKQRMIKMQVDAARGRGAISARISQIMKEWGEKKRQALLRMKSDAKLSGEWVATAPTGPDAYPF